MAGRTARVDRGRFHSYKLDGQKCDGVTWAIDNGVPKKALIGWASREAATYAVERSGSRPRWTALNWRR